MHAGADVYCRYTGRNFYFTSRNKGDTIKIRAPVHLPLLSLHPGIKYYEGSTHYTLIRARSFKPICLLKALNLIFSHWIWFSGTVVTSGVFTLSTIYPSTVKQGEKLIWSNVISCTYTICVARLYRVTIFILKGMYQMSNVIKLSISVSFGIYSQ